MFTNNPYAQAGWPNPGNPLSIEASYGSTSILYPTLGPIQDFHRQRRPVSILTFDFVFQEAEILNSIVYGPQGAQYMSVKTVFGMTTIQRESGVFATIDWNNGGYIEARDFIPRMYAAHFLKLSPDLRYRLLSINEKKFLWEAKEDGTYLYHTDTSVHHEVARLHIPPDCRRAVLQISMENFEDGLIQRAILSAVLLYSGIKFD